MLRALFFVEFYENIVFKITMLKILINIKTNTKTTFWMKNGDLNMDLILRIRYAPISAMFYSEVETMYRKVQI